MLFDHWKDVEEIYKSLKPNRSEDAILQYFGGSVFYKDIAHLVSIDIDHLNCRASQNTIDIWHLSGKSQHEFIQTQLTNFQPHSKSIYSSFAGYLPQFTRSFYSPLPLYTSNEPDLSLGDVNYLIENKVEIIQELQQQHVEPHCAIHVDLQCVYKLYSKPRHEANLNESGDNFEADPIFGYKEPVRAQAVKDQKSKPEIPRAEAADDEKVNGPKGKESGMKRILRGLLAFRSKSYHHYELKLNGKNLTSSELPTNVPRCSVEYSPLCKIYNTINRMKESKCAEDEGLITISFHKYSDHVCLYLFFRDAEGQIHGQRIFINELTTVLVQLFKDQVITKETVSLLDRIQLKEDKDFTKFADFLQEKKQDVVQQDNDGIIAKLNEFVFEYNNNRDVTKQISGNAVICCFRENDMDYSDYKDLRVNLKRYGVRADPARKLWRFLNPVEEDDDENVIIIPIGSYIYIPAQYERILFGNN